MLPMAAACWTPMKTRGLFYLRVILSLAIVWTAQVTRAEGAAKYEGSYWAFLNTKKILEAGEGITLDKYPDSDDATVDKKMLRVYRADGTAETQDETVTKVLSEKGKRNNRTL